MTKILKKLQIPFYLEKECIFIEFLLDWALSWKSWILLEFVSLLNCNSYRLLLLTPLNF